MSQKLTALIVAVDPAERERMGNCLSRAYEVEFATHEDAMDAILARMESTALVLLETAGSWKEILSRIRNGEGTRDLPVVAYAKNGLGSEAVRLGAADCVTEEDDDFLILSRADRAAERTRDKRALLVCGEESVFQVSSDRETILVLMNRKGEMKPGTICDTQALLCRVHPEDAEEFRGLLEKTRSGEGMGKCYCRIRSEGYHWYRMNALPSAESGCCPGSVLVSATDVHESYMRETRLREMTQSDTLTGMKNEAAFELEVKRRLDLLSAGMYGTFMMVDGDEFKSINDQFGHTMGDRVIKLAGEMILRRIRIYDIAARLHGDEFAIWLEGPSSKEVGQKILSDINSMIRREAESSGIPAFTLSAGMAVARMHGDYEELYREADAALYRAKGAGRACAM